MNSNFTIKNFRAFNNDGADIEIRPITVLTGCNSSGKSSFVKALLLLNEIFRKNNRDNVLMNSKLDFTSETLSMLGDYSTIHNEEAAKQGNDIEISYDVISAVLLGKYNITMSFCPTSNDRINNGRVKDVVIKGEKSNLIWGIRNSDEQTGISALKERFFAFYSVMYVLDALNSMYCECNILGTKTDEELSVFVKDEMMPTLKKIKEVVGGELVYTAIETYANRYAYASGISANVKKWTARHLECFDKSMELGVLTYIPELSVISEFPKDDFANNFIKFCADKELANITEDDINLIIEAFLKSDSTTFVDFYRDLENKHIDNIYNPINPSTIMSLDFLRKDKSTVLNSLNYHLRIPHFWKDCSSVDLGNGITWSDLEEVSLTNNDLTECSLFELIYYLLLQLHKSNSSSTEFAKYVKECDDDLTGHRYQSYVLDEFIEYINEGLKDILSHNICNDLEYVGSARINIKRLYALDNSDDFTRTLAEYFEAIRVFNSHSELKYEPDTFMNRWLRDFGIGYKIEINPIGPGLGAMPVIYKDENDQKGRALADYGYGISQLISVLIEIETSILKGKVVEVRNVIDREKGSIDINGLFGFNRTYKYQSRTIAIEEPEIHLHPMYQSLLADMFLDAYTNYGINFIIETHSEYLVRKLQTIVARKQIDKELVSITYVESGSFAEKKARRIKMKEDGCLMEPFGSGFFDEADNLAMNLLMIKGGLA